MGPPVKKNKKNFHKSPKTIVILRSIREEFFFEGNKMRTCATCGELFDPTSYQQKYCCKTCKRKVDKRRAKIRHGPTIEAYDWMLKNQNNRCAICGKHQSEMKRQFAVDRDHDTGEIRGLLCTRCNLVLGQVKDNPDILRKAIDYLI